MFLAFSKQNVKVLFLVVFMQVYLMNDHKASTADHAKNYYDDSTKSDPIHLRSGTKTLTKNEIKSSVMEFLQESHQLSIPKQMLQNHLTKVLLTCNILRKRMERTHSKIYRYCFSSCIYIGYDVDKFYSKFCSNCVKYLDISGDIDIAICEKNMNYLKVGKFFEIYNQKKKRNETKSGNRQKRADKGVNRNRQSDVTETTSTQANTELSSTDNSVDSDIHISKRGLNETVNQTDTGMEDWAAILRMQYSKDPQWALICVVFVVTLILVCVWYSGMCNSKHGDFIDPVMTHNLRPEYVRDVVSRKARFLAWFLYLKKRRKHRQQKKESERLISSSSDEDLFDMTDMTEF